MTENNGNSRRSDAVLIVGAGIGGMQSALLLAEAGHKVYLVDSAPGIGGSLHLLDLTFPTDSCGVCHMLPGRAAYCPTIECDLHPNIELVPYAEVVGLEGEPGAFTATIRRKPRYVSVERCIECGLCAEVCPEERPDIVAGYDVSGFGMGGSETSDLKPETPRKAVYRPQLRAIPPAYVIDMDYCTRCGKCVEVCPTGAIDLEMKPVEETVQVGAVVLTPGFAPFDARRKGEFGFGHYDNVLSGIQFERMVSFAGPTGGRILRPSDGKKPRRIAFIHCVGSRDLSVDRGYCSSVCCMYTAKQVRVAKRLEPDLEITVFHMDIRAHGKDFDEYFDEVKELPGVTYRRSMVSSVHQFQQTRDLVVNYVAEDGSVREETFDMVVLAVGFGPPEEAQALAEAAGIGLNRYGFGHTDAAMPTHTTRPGVFIAGAFREPKDIPETVVEASAAAAEAARLLRRPERSAEEAAPEERDVTWEWPRVGVFLCDHYGEIGQVVDLEGVAEAVRRLPNVALAQVMGNGLGPAALEEIARVVREENLNRVVLAGYTDLRRESAFREMMAAAGLNFNLLERVNLRSEVAGALPGDGRVATEKAKALVAMAVAGVLRRQPFRPSEEPLVRRVLVIGGGLAGLTAALTLADLGHPVDLVERSDALGGQLRQVHTVWGASTSPAEMLASLIERVQNHPQVRLRMQAEVTAASGRLGDFHVTLTPAEGEPEEEVYGAIVVATGGREVTPTEYLYGEEERVVTQRQLSAMLAEGKEIPEDVVMIQCVGSREPGRPYCSRICCTQAVVNALAIKERNPDARVTILFREVRTYGFREDAYREAREKGVVFLRYDLEHKPEVRVRGSTFEVAVREPILGQEVTIPADLVVLSVGIEPNDNRALAEALGLELDGNGFFQEEHPKMRPLDFTQRGIFVCGLAHSPRPADETVLMAQGAAMRAASLLAKERLVAQRTVAQVNVRLCSACGLCVEACPYGARVLEPGEPYAEVVEALCQGCGVCVAVCPNGASSQVGFAMKQVYDVLDAALG
ncbi:MAG TPA: CoB--CoM heterodisulfide reductase iron-sulfur subunit A family protein [Anaerolineales bacterium]|nr:CoB--CoM heterodisulfide reductase iron-sulfur subunit A family protein [Anaerolineales bacterium]